MRWIYFVLGVLIIVNFVELGKLFGNRVRLKEREKNRLRDAEEQVSQLEEKNRRLFEEAQGITRAVQDYGNAVRTWESRIQEDVAEIDSKAQCLLELNRRMSKQLHLVETLCEAKKPNTPEVRSAVGELRRLLAEDDQLLKDWEDARLRRGDYAQQSMPVEELFESRWRVEP